MSTVVIGPKGRWTVSVLVAVAVVIGALSLIRMPPLVPKPASEAPTASLPAVQVVPRNVLSEKTMMLDLAPLFLPTKFNAVLPDVDFSHREPGQRVLESALLAKTPKGAQVDLQKQLPQVVTINGHAAADAQPLDAFALDPYDRLALGMGRKSIQVAAEKPRGGYLEAIEMKTGRQMLASDVPADARPDGDEAWRPFEIMAATDAAGLVGPLTIVPPGSGVEKVDSALLNFLAKTYRIGERLPPGFYRISVTP